MTRLVRIAPLFAMAALFASPSYAVDCASLMANMTKKNASSRAVSQVDDCILRGWEPSVTMRPDNGLGAAALASGGGGFVAAGIQAPNEPPAVRGRAASVSAAKMGFAGMFPPWKGFPCQLPGGKNICEGDGDGGGDTSGGGGDGTTTGTCPVNDDTTGTFGQKQEITASSKFSLTCGGAAPLSTYQITLSKNPGGMVSTEYGSPYIWAYKINPSGGYTSTGAAVKMPTYLCRHDGKSMVESVRLQAPIAQMIVYNAGASAVAIRLIPESDLPDPMFPDPSEPAENYLIVPMRNGIPQMPSDCANESDVYKPLTDAGGDLTFESTVQPNCEGPEGFCSSTAVTTTVAGSTGVSALPNCETVAVYPSSSDGTSSGGTDCSATTQMLVVDRPNLVYPPGSSISASAIEGRTAVLAATTAGSKIYTSSEAIIRLNRGGSPFTLPEGGMLALRNGGRLVMNAPATINTANGSILLTNGGSIHDAGGTALANYSANTSVSPEVTWPMTVRLNRNIDMPAGYMVPTQPAPFVRGPVNEP